MKIETPLLRRLGPVPFWRGEKRCLDALEDIYRRAAEKARRALAADPPDPDGKRPGGEC
ncbi:MAG: hypothetical protein K6F50_08520 [Kiritimatiellae bacterium]|nr:hypothetical protein [Kiritimatiellia bacterium]